MVMPQMQTITNLCLLEQFKKNKKMRLNISQGSVTVL